MWRIGHPIGILSVMIVLGFAWITFVVLQHQRDVTQAQEAAIEDGKGIVAQFNRVGRALGCSRDSARPGILLRDALASLAECLEQERDVVDHEY